MLIKEFASAAAFMVTVGLFAPYILSIRRGTTIPHVFSWAVWALGTFIVFFAQLADGAGIGAWPIGFSASITCYVALLAYRVRRSFEITRQDWVLFVLAVTAIPAWGLTDDPFWAVVFLTAADLLGFGPTLRKAYAYPFQEHLGFFALGALRNIFVVIALENYSWTTVLFPAAVGIACLVVAGFLVLRRTALTQQIPAAQRSAGDEATPGAGKD